MTTNERYSEEAEKEEIQVALMKFSALWRIKREDP